MKKKRGFEKMIEKRPDSPIGIIIKARLKEMDHSQQWLARKVNRANGTINFIVKGRLKPSYELLKMIASVLSIDVKVLSDVLEKGDKK